MTAPSSIDPAHFLHEQLAQASPDLLRQMLSTSINTLMSAEADAVCGAEYGARSTARSTTSPTPPRCTPNSTGCLALQAGHPGSIPVNRSTAMSQQPLHRSPATPLTSVLGAAMTLTHRASEASIRRCAGQPSVTAAGDHHAAARAARHPSGTGTRHSPCRACAAARPHVRRAVMRRPSGRGRARTRPAEGGGVLILAHRGLPGLDRPENSIAAVNAAYSSGADGVEVDLRLTADGVLALSHDADLRRLTGLPMGIADSTWPALCEQAALRGVRLARADEVLAQSGGRRVVLEVKEPPPGRASDGLIALAVEELLGSWPASAAADVTVSSFSRSLVGTVRASLPPDGGVRTALLGLPRDPMTALLRQALKDGHDELHPHVSSLTADAWLVAAAQACGLAVVPWTVNRQQDILRLEALGVDGLITDVPAAARAALTRAAA